MISNMLSGLTWSGWGLLAIVMSLFLELMAEVLDQLTKAPRRIEAGVCVGLGIGVTWMLYLVTP
jgi:hypothetical protein